MAGEEDEDSSETKYDRSRCLICIQEDAYAEYVTHKDAEYVSLKFFEDYLKTDELLNKDLAADTEVAADSESAPEFDKASKTDGDDAKVDVISDEKTERLNKDHPADSEVAAEFDQASKEDVKSDKTEGYQRRLEMLRDGILQLRKTTDFKRPKKDIHLKEDYEHFVLEHFLPSIWGLNGRIISLSGSVRHLEKKVFPHGILEDAFIQAESADD